MRHIERHRTHRTGWLRAAVLGANDGIVSTASLVLGVAASGAGTQGILVAGVAGLVAGAMSMAAGEYVSVSSQADTERADLARESKELAANPRQELEELTAIYVGRGLDEPLASDVATQLTKHDALAAHGRDELGISDTLAAKPVLFVQTKSVARAAPVCQISRQAPSTAAGRVWLLAMFLHRRSGIGRGARTAVPPAPRRATARQGLAGLEAWRPGRPNWV